MEINMDLSFVLKIGGIGMIVAVVCQVLSKAGRDDQSTMVSITGIVIILLLVVEEMGVLMDSLRKIFGI